MITKINSIKNLAVFQNFEWDKSLRDEGNNVVNFNKINILYGRNYSGKTTLSRIVKALDSGILSDKYRDPVFEVCFEGNIVVTPSNLLEHGRKIRVFNEDFIKENLHFIVNADESIAPFAIIGENVALEEEIEKLENELGKSEEGKESGFYLELKRAHNSFDVAFETHKLESDNLTKRLREKAIGDPAGIKYCSDRFGDINYNISKLIAEIKLVTNSQFTPISDEEVYKLTALIKEYKKEDIQSIRKSNFDFGALNIKAKELITKSVSRSNKIEQLLNDAIMGRWVKEGRNIHKGKLDICAFCGNNISENRWQELESHFDEESEKLENEIEQLRNRIEEVRNNLDFELQIDIGLFYSIFNNDLELLIQKRLEYIAKLKSDLTRIVNDLLERKNDILNTKDFTDIIDHKKQLDELWYDFEVIRTKMNNYNKSLESKQNEAKKLLRLREVSDFVRDIDYKSIEQKLQNLEVSVDLEGKKKQAIEQKINDRLQLIQAKKNQLRDERKGAQKVNEYLTNYFGHESLSLQAQEMQDKIIRFEVMRNGDKAYHLSEGECSLIAFSYFLAKLEDTETKGTKPIIWIDDPISSLDTNHIFFVFSLIDAEIVSKNNFEQLFISTHNLDFLKYLKRLPTALNKKSSAYFLVTRLGSTSKIRVMPTYLKEYVTEFNFLFHQIYKCAVAEIDDESQNDLFYNFGNNARKFLEVFLYYRYPDANRDTKRLAKFFGDDTQASAMVARINHEFSHLEGLFERSMAPLEIPEMNKTAKYILKKIKERDPDQYTSLLSSIGAAKDV